tara:strand:+ start:931 stop:1998 length:1068 start_codon:yes stop_codon:yes gene_type:complete
VTKFKFKIKNLFVYKDTSIFEVIKNLAKNKIGIVLVVDLKNKLLGTITDGDVRRSILKYSDINLSAKKIMKKSPKFLKNSKNLEKIKSFMFTHNILHVPILNNKNQVIDIKTKSDFKKSNQKNNTVFISAGGFGKRLQPLTNNLPKPMIKIDNVPILEIIINKFVNYGFKKFIISTHFKSSLIKKYFGNGKKLGIDINYIEEKKPLGTIGSLSLIEVDKIKEPIIIMNSDIITELNFDDLLEFHKLNKSDATICTSKYEYQVPYGEVVSTNLDVKELLEKPKKTINISAGIYVLEKKILKILIKNAYLDMPILLKKLIKSKKKVTIFPLYEYWTDIGHFDELKKAKHQFMLNKKK